MKLRSVEKLKKEARLYKNINDKINGKKLGELNPELSDTLAKLVERKKLLEALNKDNFGGIPKETLYQDIEFNNRHFESMDSKKRENIEEQFQKADDSYAGIDQWQNLYMAFLSTSNLSGYKAVDHFNATFEEMKKRKAEMDESKKGLWERRKELQRKYPDFNPKTAKTEYAKYQKEIVKLKTEKEKLEQASDEKEVEVSAQMWDTKKQYKKDMAEFELQKEKIVSEYRNTKKELEERKQKLEEVYKTKKILDSINPLTIEGKEIYTQTGAVLESAEYFANLNTKEYTALKNEYLQAKEGQEKAKADVAKNATGPLKRYLEEKITEKETANLEVLQKVMDFFDVCKNPYAPQAEKYIKQNPQFNKPIAEIKMSVGEYINGTLARNKRGVREETKKEIAFAESFRAAIKEFAAVYLRDVPNPTDKQIDEVVNMLENLKPAEGQRLLQNHRKVIENGVNKRKAAIFSELSETEKKDCRAYEAPEKTDKLLGMLEESRKVYNAKVVQKKDTIFYKEKLSVTMEEAERRLQQQCDKEIEDLIKKEIQVGNRKLIRQAGIKFATSEYFENLNEKEYTALKEEYLRTKEAQEKAKADVAKNATGALERYLNPGFTKQELADVELIKKTLGFYNVCRSPKSAEAKKFLAQNPQLGKPESRVSVSLASYLDTVMEQKGGNGLTEEEEKEILFVESFKASLQEVTAVFLRDVKNPTKEQLEEVENMLQGDYPGVGAMNLEAKIKQIERGVKDRRENALSEFTPEDKEKYEIYTAPEKTDKLLGMLEESRKQYDKMVNNEIEEASTMNGEKITKEEAIRRVQIKSDKRIDRMIEREIQNKGEKLLEKYNVKNFHVSASDRKLRYDVWLKKELENIAVYEKNNGSMVNKGIQKEIDEIERKTEENKQRWKKIGEIDKNILTVRPEQYKKDMEELKQGLTKFNEQTEEKIDEIDMEINKNLIPMKIAARFLFKDTKHKKMVENMENTVKKNCKEVPKLDFNPVIKESHNTAAALLKQKAVYAKGHTNSKEFNNMMNALEVVVKWGEKNPALEKMQNPPKSYEEALDQLKANRDIYREAKDRQRRLFPTKMRRMRLELADAIDVFVDTEKVRLKEIAVDEKAVESWNKYFESGGKTSIVKAQNKALGKDTKQMEKTEVEIDDMDFGI